MRKILGVFEVFLGIFKKTKEKQDREFRTKFEELKELSVCDFSDLTEWGLTHMGSDRLWLRGPARLLK